jgi:predicted metal-dependent phosphotriesterase family hydrolase
MGNPSPVEGIETFIRSLLENGLTENDIRKMWVENPQ